MDVKDCYLMLSRTFEQMERVGLKANKVVYGALINKLVGLKKLYTTTGRWKKGEDGLMLKLIMH